MRELDPRDRELLSALQGELPLVSTPYAVLGQQLDMSEKEVIKRAERLKREGHVKLIAATFDTRALGYKSCLVAARVAEEALDHAASLVNLHPGVTQNYARNHAYNLWFTLSVPPDSTLGIESTVERLGAMTAWSGSHLFPTLRSFKASSDEAADPASPSPLEPEEIDVVRLLQRDFPLLPRPYDMLARTSKIDADTLLTITRRLAATRRLKRISAVVHARRQSFSASAMGVWAVPPKRIDEIGAAVASHASVTQCFLRPTYDDWPYNLFATVHGRTVDECEAVLGDIADENGLAERRVLFPVKEYKRSRLNLFSGDVAEWEARSESGGRAASAAS